MPLPRFARLPPPEQRRILDAATQVFAEDGVDHASYNRVIAATGISKSSAYNYFDGREDLLHAVLDDVAARLSAVLGHWPKAADPKDFWFQIRSLGANLETHIAGHPNDLALIDPAFLLRSQGLFMTWISDVVDNGFDLGIITVDCERDLLIAATAAVLRAGDGWGAAQLRAGQNPDPEQLWILIENLWGGTAVSRHSRTQGRR